MKFYIRLYVYPLSAIWYPLSAYLIFLINVKISIWTFFCLTFILSLFFLYLTFNLFMLYTIGLRGSKILVSTFLNILHHLSICYTYSFIIFSSSSTPHTLVTQTPFWCPLKIFLLYLLTYLFDLHFSQTVSDHP